MLSSQNRLKKTGNINQISKKGNLVAGNFIFLKFTKNNLDINRFAFAVGLKISKKAVLRNKIKRRLRESIKENLLKLKTGSDFLIVARPRIIKEGYRAIKKELEALFKKIKAYQ